MRCLFVQTFVKPYNLNYFTIIDKGSGNGKGDRRLLPFLNCSFQNVQIVFFEIRSTEALRIEIK